METSTAKPFRLWHLKYHIKVKVLSVLQYLKIMKL